MMALIFYNTHKLEVLKLSSLHINKLEQSDNCKVIVNAQKCILNSLSFSYLKSQHLLRSDYKIDFI